MAISAFERVTNDRTLAATVAVHAAATMAMVGLIWTVQVVHYPLFESVGAEAYPNYQSRHIDRIGAVLVVPWGLEGLSIVALLVLARERTMRVLAVAGAALMGLILLVTMIWAAPVHGELLDGFDPEQHDTLMVSNLVRTLLWTARGGVAMAMVWVLLDRRTDSVTKTAREERRSPDSVPHQDRH
tara:strand:+ start:1517 stop:2071 length:555 start_codon:yes stop_codon:yes gene_type:complete